MGIIRAGIKAAKVAKQIKDAGGAAPAVGKGAREVVKRIAPLGTGRIVDKVIGQKVEDAVTKKAQQVQGNIQGRMGHFNSAAGASSNNSPWDDWDSPSTPSTPPPPSSNPAVKKDPFEF